MFTIKENSIYQYEIKKSKFITLLYKIHTIDDIEVLLRSIRNTYSDATHCCFAYKLDNTQKFSDDGEPGGTAGLPIMEVLNKKDLDHILCVVIRYFGGIKLGAGGLVRAYGKAVRDAINQNEIIELIPGYFIKLQASYDSQKQLDYMLGNKVIKKDFQEEIIYYINISKDDIDMIKNYSYEIIEEKMIEKRSN